MRLSPCIPALPSCILVLAFSLVAALTAIERGGCKLASDFPNNVQKALIERAARLTLYIELMEAQALKDGTMSERNSRQYLAWCNALRLCLREIGIEESAAAKPPALREYLTGEASP
jgi:hypothetical protein